MTDDDAEAAGGEDLYGAGGADMGDEAAGGDVAPGAGTSDIGGGVSDDDLGVDNTDPGATDIGAGDASDATDRLETGTSGG